MLKAGMPIRVERRDALPSRLHTPDAAYDVLAVLDAWRAAGRWWRGELPGSHFAVELEGGLRAAICERGGRWRVERVQD